MYRNAFYDNKEGTIRLRTWTEDGKRIDTDVPFSPFLYTESTTPADATSIFRTHLKRRVFKNNMERSKFVKETC